MEHEKASRVSLTCPVGNLCERCLLMITRLWAVVPLRAPFFFWVLDNFPVQAWVYSLVPSGHQTSILVFHTASYSTQPTILCSLQTQGQSPCILQVVIQSPEVLWFLHHFSTSSSNRSRSLVQQLHVQCKHSNHGVTNSWRALLRRPQETISFGIQPFALLFCTRMWVLFFLIIMVIK